MISARTRRVCREEEPLQPGNQSCEASFKSCLMEASSDCSLSNRSEETAGEDAGSGWAGSTCATGLATAGLRDNRLDRGSPDPGIRGNHRLCRKCRLRGKRRPGRKRLIRRRRRLGAKLRMNEVAVQDIVTAAHQPQRDPISDRQHNDANNTNLNHFGVRLKAPMIQCLRARVKPERQAFAYLVTAGRPR